MQASNIGARGLQALGPADAELARALWHGAAGWTVRCTPNRRTVMCDAPGGVWFAKLRAARPRDAEAEWRWLHELPRLGVRTARPIAFVREGRRTMVVTEAVAGRGFDALLRERDSSAEAIRDAIVRTAPLVRALHERGLVFRDLYWNHVFAAPRAGADEAPVFLDVERVFAPRWRLRRWRVKDLAGLCASAPANVPLRAQLRFLRACLGQRLRDHRALLRDVERKAARIRAHAPRYG